MSKLPCISLCFLTVEKGVAVLVWRRVLTVWMMLCSRLHISRCCLSFLPSLTKTRIRSLIDNHAIDISNSKEIYRSTNQDGRHIFVLVNHYGHHDVTFERLARFRHQMTNRLWGASRLAFYRCFRLNHRLLSVVTYLRGCRIHRNYRFPWEQ